MGIPDGNCDFSGFANDVNFFMGEFIIYISLPSWNNITIYIYRACRRWSSGVWITCGAEGGGTCGVPVGNKDTGNKLLL